MSEEHVATPTDYDGSSTMPEDGDAIDAASVRISLEEHSDAIAQHQAIIKPEDGLGPLIRKWFVTMKVTSGWEPFGPFYLQQAADAVGAIDLALPQGAVIARVRMAVRHPARTGSAPGANANRLGWALYRRELGDTGASTWFTPQLVTTVSPTIVGFSRDDQSVNLAGYQSQHYIELDPATLSAPIDNESYHYYFDIQGETAAGYNVGEPGQFHGIEVQFYAPVVDRGAG
jgi:hypothetical protein